MVLLMASRFAKPVDMGKPSSKRVVPLPSSPKIESSRTALRLVCEEMLAVLSQIAQALGLADSDAYDHMCGGKAGKLRKEAPPPRCDFFIHQRSFGPHTMDLARLQKLVRNTLVSSYRKQLKADRAGDARAARCITDVRSWYVRGQEQDGKKLVSRGGRIRLLS
eukprot:5909765-Amphidinium_carterae.2